MARGGVGGVGGAGPGGAGGVGGRTCARAGVQRGGGLQEPLGARPHARALPLVHLRTRRVTLFYPSTALCSPYARVYINNFIFI